MPDPWQIRAETKRAHIASSIPPEWTLPAHLLTHEEEGVRAGGSVQDIPAKSNILTPAELALTETSAVDLAMRIRNGELKSVDVVRAVCKRASIAVQSVCSSFRGACMNTIGSRWGMDCYEGRGADGEPGELRGGILPRNGACPGEGIR